MNCTLVYTSQLLSIFAERSEASFFLKKKPFSIATLDMEFIVGEEKVYFVTFTKKMLLLLCKAFQNNPWKHFLCAYFWHVFIAFLAKIKFLEMLTLSFEKT